MGVDFLACELCGDTFPDCGEFVRCDCGKDWCDEGCAEIHGYRAVYDDDGDLFETSCNFCRCEDYSDEELLEYALEILGLSRYDLIKKKNSQTK